MEVWKTDYQPVKKHTLRDEVGMMVLDTGCLKTVAGQVWFDAFVDSLDPETRKMISAQESGNVLKFGGGERRKSIRMFLIPCSVAGHDIVLCTEVVEQNDLLCLLSKESMKRAGVKIDVKEDKIVIFGQKEAKNECVWTLYSSTERSSPRRE